MSRGISSGIASFIASGSRLTKVSKSRPKIIRVSDFCFQQKIRITVVATFHLTITQ